MRNLEVGTKAFIINDPLVSQNNWAVVTLVEISETKMINERWWIEFPDSMLRVPNKGSYWIVEGDLVTFDVNLKMLYKSKYRAYKPENLIPLKGDFNNEYETTKSSLSCLSY